MLPTFTLAMSLLALTPGDCDPPCPPGAIDENEACRTDINRGCYGTPPGGSNCCIPNGTPTCDNVPCVELVCEIDSFCCAVAWDSICVDEVLSTCPELCAGTWQQAWSPIALGQVICGSLTTGEPALLDDADWYELHLEATTQVTVTLTGGPPMQLAIVDNDGNGVCGLEQELEPAATVAPCSSVAVTACLEAGTHWILVRPDVQEGLACDARGTRYVLEVQQSAPRCTLPDPINDTCATASPIQLGVTPFSTHDANTESGVLLTCDGDIDEIYRDVWFSFLAPRTGTLRISTCGTLNFNAHIRTYAGRCEALVDVACFDSAAFCAFTDPQIDVDVIAGETYLIRYGATNDVDGAATVTLSYLPCSFPYEVEVIQGPLHQAIPRAISSDGEIVGTWTETPGAPIIHGFRWSERNGYQTTSPSESALFDVNADGLAVGWLKSGTSMWPGSTEGLTIAALPPIVSCLTGIANGVNASDVVVGHVTCGPAPVRWVKGAGELIPGLPSETDRALKINDSGSIVGDGKPGSFVQGWVRIDDEFQWLPSPIELKDLFPTAINNANQVAANVMQNSTTPMRGVIWNDGAFTTIEPPVGFTRTSADDITDAGVVVGNLGGSGVITRAYIRKQGAIVELSWRTGTSLGYPLRSANVISANGVIAGMMNNVAGRLKPIPPTGDLDCNAVVDAADLAELLGAWGPCPANTSCNPDFNVDGVVDAADLAIVLGAWGPVRVR